MVDSESKAELSGSSGPHPHLLGEGIRIGQGSCRVTQCARHHSRPFHVVVDAVLSHQTPQLLGSLSAESSHPSPVSGTCLSREHPSQGSQLRMTFSHTNGGQLLSVSQL